MQNIIMPMDGFGYCPTAEFDVIVSCNAGVFVFEIKGYTGNSIEISKTEKEISEKILLPKFKNWQHR